MKIKVQYTPQFALSLSRRLNDAAQTIEMPCPVVVSKNGTKKVDTSYLSAGDLYRWKKVNDISGEVYSIWYSNRLSEPNSPLPKGDADRLRDCMVWVTALFVDWR